MRALRASRHRPMHARCAWAALPARFGRSPAAQLPPPHHHHPHHRPPHHCCCCSRGRGHPRALGHCRRLCCCTHWSCPRALHARTGTAQALQQQLQGAKTRCVHGRLAALHGGAPLSRERSAVQPPRTCGQLLQQARKLLRPLVAWLLVQHCGAGSMRVWAVGATMRRALPTCGGQLQLPPHLPARSPGPPRTSVPASPSPCAAPSARNEARRAMRGSRAARWWRRVCTSPSLQRRAMHPCSPTCSSVCCSWVPPRMLGAGAAVGRALVPACICWAAVGRVLHGLHACAVVARSAKCPAAANGTFVAVLGRTQANLQPTNLYCRRSSLSIAAALVLVLVVLQAAAAAAHSSRQQRQATWGRLGACAWATTRTHGSLGSQPAHGGRRGRCPCTAAGRGHQHVRCPRGRRCRLHWLLH